LAGSIRFNVSLRRRRREMVSRNIAPDLGTNVKAAGPWEIDLD
jgi:hypothetical protein